MRRLLIIIALLVIFPIIELAVLISIGKVIGVGWTILLVIATSALGGWLLRREGGKAWLTFQEDLQAGRPPGKSATEGLLVLLGGIFMLIPGFISDIIGAFLIAPPTRKLARVGLLAVLDRRISPAAASTLFGPRRVRAEAGPVQYGPSYPAQSTAPPSSTMPQSSMPQSSMPQSSMPQSSAEPPIGPPIEGEIIDPRR